MRVLLLIVALTWPSIALAELDGSLPTVIQGSESDYGPAGTEPGGEPVVSDPLPECTAESIDNLSCSCAPDSKVAVCETPTDHLSTTPDDSDAQ
jgi:hypothetical protein